MWKFIKTSISSIMIDTALAIPQYSKMSPEGLLKSLLVETSGFLPRVSVTPSFINKTAE
jgi:hypothetical protein